MSVTSGNKKRRYNIANRYDYLAVAEHQEISKIYRYDIQKFREELQKPNQRLASHPFPHSDGGIDYEWQLLVDTKFVKKLNDSGEKREYLAIFLNFLKGRQPTVVTYEVGILNQAGDIFKYELNHTFKEPESHGWGTFLKTEVILDPQNHLLDGDTLRIYCSLCIKLPPVQKLFSSEKLEPVNDKIRRYNDLFMDFEDLLISSLFSDVTLETQDKTFKAHKGILSCRSSVFKAMFLNDMFESINNTVKITDFGNDIVQGMLQYIYSGWIKAKTLEDKVIEFLQIAEKYDITGLKEESEDIIAEHLSVENVAETLCLADTHQALNLKAKAIKYFNINKAEVIQTEGFKKMAISNKSLFMDLYLAN